MPFAAKTNMYQSDSEMVWYFIWWLYNEKNILLHGYLGI